MGVNDEPLRSPVVPAKAVEPRHPSQLGSYIPGSLSRQKEGAFFRWQLGNRFEIHLQAGFESPLNLPKRSAVNSEVKIDTDRLPILTAPVSITPD